MAAVAQYAKETKVLEWETDDIPSAYVVPMIPRRGIVVHQSFGECRFFLASSSEDEYVPVETTIDYQKVTDDNTSLEELFPAEAQDVERIEAQSQVMAIANYQDNWDGYGAIRPLSECLSHALDIINDAEISLNYLTDIYPNPNGTISLEWEQDDNEIGLELGCTEFSYYTHIGDRHSYNNKKQYAADEFARLAECVSLLG